MRSSLARGFAWPFPKLAAAFVAWLMLACAIAAGIATPRHLLAQPTRALSATDVSGDLRVLRNALETVHPGYARYATRRQLDTAWARLERRVQSGTTDAELYRETALLLALIRCGHTKAEFPATIAAWRDSAATFLPFRFRIVDGRMQTLTATAGIPRGSIIVRINGVPVDSLRQILTRYASVDGYTDHARDALLAFDSDVFGSNFDHYYPVVFGAPRTWELDVQLKAAAARGASTHRVTTAPLTYAAWSRLDAPGVLRNAEFGTGTMWRMLDDTTALLVVPSFVNYRKPVNADSLLGKIFASMRARRVRHLVLDLRANSGGSTDAAEALLRHLAHRPVSAWPETRQRVLRFGDLPRYVSTWGDRRAIFEPDSADFERTSDGGWRARATSSPLQPAVNAFSGEVSVLTSTQNASGATMLLAVLQSLGAETGRLRLIGEATGGSAEGPTAGQILFVTLPASGIRVRVPVKQTFIALPFTRGFGVFPDVEVIARLDDVNGNIGAATDRTLAVARTRPFVTRGAGSRAASSSGALSAAMIGTWHGLLEYRDYTSDKMVRIPVEQRIARTDSAGVLAQWTVYDDGPGKTIVSRDWLRVDARGGGWTEQPVGEPAEGNGSTTRYRLSVSRAGRDWRLLLAGNGTDNDKPVEMRYTVRISADSTTRRKEFRAAGGAWEFRHEYRFAREPR